MSDARRLYRIEGVPVLQNRVFNTAAEARECVRGNVTLVQDSMTGLVFNEEFEPGILHYDQNYNNEQSLSPAFQQHLAGVELIVERHLGRTNLMEVGCGKGYFLDMLQSKGFDIEGCDPTYEGSNPKIRTEFFNAALGIRGKNIILRHVLEHIPDPVGFLRQLAEANGDGRIYIEVPCFDWILNHRTWFDVFYEHVNYFRLADLQRMFSRVHESGRIFGSQYLFIVADLATIQMPRADGDWVEFPSDFLSSLYSSPAPMGDVVWGAASKGVIYSLLRERMGMPMDIAVDINTTKQGKYMPTTGVEIFSPEEFMDSERKGCRICVMNSNYLAEIKNLTHHHYHYMAIDHD